jgi:RND superfamily putative drug exporter
MNALAALSTRRIARMSAHRPRTVLAVWLVVVLIAVYLSSAVLPGVLTTEQDFTIDPESAVGQDLLEKAGLASEPQAQEIVLVRSTDGTTVDAPAFREAVEQLFGEIAALGDDQVASVASYYVTGFEGFVSRDRTVTFMPVVMAGTIDDASENIHDLTGLVHAADGRGGFDVLLTGDATLGAGFQEVAEADLIKGESIGIGVAIIILLAVFGTLVAALVPIILAVVAIVVATGLTALVGQAFDLSFFVTNMITMMGLAVGIDYSLFIVSRYREELHRGHAPRMAAELAGATATRAVFFSGVTVVLALVGMLLVPTSIFLALGTGAILVVVSSVLAALTLLPAILSLLGSRVDRLRVRRISRGVPGEEGGFWTWLTRQVMARPVVFFLAATALLLAAASPYLNINTGAAGVSTLPDGMEAKEGFVLLQSAFDRGATTDQSVVIAGDVGEERVDAAVEALREALAADAAFAGPFAYNVDALRTVGQLVVPVRGDPTSEEAVAALRRLRDQYIPAAFATVPAGVYVTGIIAFNVDFFDLAAEYTPIVFTFVLALSFLLLLVVFRSIVIPIKAIIMNLLSVGAAYGLIVLVTQQGVGADLFGFQQSDVVEAWIPLFLFSVLFGLSMDYHVFLLSRIRERYDETGDNTGSVAFGLRSTAGLITGAALIMVAVFGGFAAGQLVTFQQMGFGLAVAVLIDATIIRSILVPAGMKMLGRANWYFPEALAWVPRVGIEGNQAPAPMGASDD